jgi:hypothetical protein
LPEPRNPRAITVVTANTDDITDEIRRERLLSQTASLSRRSLVILHVPPIVGTELNLHRLPQALRILAMRGVAESAATEQVIFNLLQDGLQEYGIASFVHRLPTPISDEVLAALSNVCFVIIASTQAAVRLADTKYEIRGLPPEAIE